MDVDEFAAEYGLGYLPLAGPNAPAPRLINDDPNATLLESLSAAEQNAWAAAADECTVEADRETALLGVTRAGWEAIRRFEAQVASDQRVLVATAEWSDCMNSAGFQLPSPTAMHDTFQRIAERLIADAAWAESSTRHGEYVRAIEEERSVAIANVNCYPPLRSVESEVVEEMRADVVNEIEDARD